MPRPHFNVQAGLRMPQPPGAAPGDSAAGCPGCKQKAAEIDRLRSELAKGHAGARPFGGKPNTALMWAALGICAACLLFALAAIMRHG